MILEDKYHKGMTERILRMLDLKGSVALPTFVSKLNDNLLSLRKRDQLAFCFRLLDLNEDGKICLTDLYKLY